MAYISTEKVKSMRDQIKKLMPSKDGWKLSITRENHSGIRVVIYQSPIELREDPTQKNETVNDYYINDRSNKDSIEILNKLVAILKDGWYDKSDLMTDYFNIAWYTHIRLGDYDKPFKVVEKKEKNNKKEIKVENQFYGETSLVYNITRIESTIITSSKQGADELRKHFELGVDTAEEFKVLMLSRRNQVIGVSTIGKGGKSGVLADPKIIFTNALLSSASGIILCHNHPSGTPKPSEADISLTKNCITIGKALDLPVLDHIILVNNSYYSFADEGLI
jgi:DNA repair protein RadC